MWTKTCCSGRPACILSAASSGHAQPWKYCKYSIPPGNTLSMFDLFESNFSPIEWVNDAIALTLRYGPTSRYFIVPRLALEKREC